MLKTRMTEESILSSVGSGTVVVVFVSLSLTFQIEKQNQEIRTMSFTTGTGKKRVGFFFLPEVLETRIPARSSTSTCEKHKELTSTTELCKCIVYFQCIVVL